MPAMSQIHYSSKRRSSLFSRVCRATYRAAFSSLTPCAACGQTIARDAKACPHCGRNVEAIQDTKRDLILIVGFAAMVAVAVWLFI